MFVKPYMIVKKQPRWLAGRRIKTIEELYSTKWIMVMEETGERMILPSWWAKGLTVKHFKSLIDKGCLYFAERNPYRN